MRFKKEHSPWELGVSGSYTAPFDGTTVTEAGGRITLKDNDAANDYRVNSPTGEYGILYAENSLGKPLNAATIGQKTLKAGLIFYQAGVIVLSSSVFLGNAENGLLSSSLQWSPDANYITASLQGSNAETNANHLRHRIYNISFNNSVELNSTIYFCHLGANEFNYSANPTYLSGSQIVVKNQSIDDPVSYMTTIGLYSSDNQLMATAKLSEPIKKTPATSLTFRVRLDY